MFQPGFLRPLFRRRPRAILAAGLAVLALGPPAAAAKGRLELSHQRLQLPGPPAVVVAADIDGDGLRDLAAVVVSTRWDRIGIEETTELDEVEGLVEVLTVVPALLDHRELFVFLAQADGTYRSAGPPLTLDASVLTLEAGPPSEPVVALTDDGISVLRLAPDTGDADPSEAAAAFGLEPLIEAAPVLARTGTFLPKLELMRDLDGDGDLDLLFPSPRSLDIYLTGEGGLATQPAFRWALPTREGDGRPLERIYPLPELRDLDGDRLPELILLHPEDGWKDVHLAFNRGGGRFSPASRRLMADDPEEAPEAGDEESPSAPARPVLLADLDGDGGAELVTQQQVDLQAEGMREELAEAKNPRFEYRIFALEPSGRPAEEAQTVFTADGFAFDGGEVGLPGGFQDLDGDGDLDLVSLSLDFSLFQAVKVVATRRIGIGLDFHISCQDSSGAEPAFRRVTGLDLSGKFNLNLNNLRVHQLSQFRGDFDGDGRLDFVQMGRGRKVSIHLGRDGCAYPPAPDLTVHLEQEPRDLALVQVRDLDGDGLSDLMVIHPEKDAEPSVTPPVRLDLYRSGGTP